MTSSLIAGDWVAITDESPGARLHPSLGEGEPYRWTGRATTPMPLISATRPRSARAPPRRQRPRPPAAIAGAGAAGIQGQLSSAVLSPSMTSGGATPAGLSTVGATIVDVARRACRCAIVEPRARGVGFSSRRGDMCSFS